MILDHVVKWNMWSEANEENAHKIYIYTNICIKKKKLVSYVKDRAGKDGK